jgi:N-acetylglutamate synthase-like GNAT family acetyltransferase
MTTSQQPVKIRRANGTDVVKLYRLLAAEHEQHFLVPVDENLALGSVLASIENGHVAVAEHSGRIVGSIGFGVFRPGYSREAILDCEWFVVVPAYKQTTVGLALLRNALKAADQYGATVRISVCSVFGEKRIDTWFKALGFAPKTTAWLRPKKNKVDDDGHGQQDTDTDPEPDSGSVVLTTGSVGGDESGAGTQSPV